MNPVAFKYKSLWLCVIALLLIGCATKVHYINEQEVEDRVGHLKIGETTFTDAHNLFGKAASGDRFRRIYRLSDTEERLREQLNNSVQVVIPAFIERAPANTLAIISLWFTDNGASSSGVR